MADDKEKMILHVDALTFDLENGQDLAPLRDKLKGRPGLSLEQVLRIMSIMAEALDQVEPEKRSPPDTPPHTLH